MKVMRKFIITTFVLGLALVIAGPAKAQMMGNFSNTTVDWNEVVEHTAREEQEGKELWDKFQAKEVACENLSDEQFGVLGEYFMGQMAGDSHAAMNAMMIQTHGEDGEEQIHIVMGKRLSGCDTSAAFPFGGSGWMPMMNMMWGGWSAPLGDNNSNNMMWNWGQNMMGWGGFGWLFTLTWIVWLIVGIFLAVWLWQKINKK
ncbi:MAG: hypothetical protein UX26_C0014G0012 [Parcubacteria group bacterium GW2011_GWC1_45_9]|nr:MAG: hypothetical protein UX26_C0014G0012 [Parcubacteria group bacterium GW2011_GWC1_45_9]